MTARGAWTAPCLLVLLAIGLAADWPDLPAPVAGSGGDGRQDAALVIGIEDYDRAPVLPGARENALAWVRWLNTARRVPLVVPLLDGDATREEIELKVVEAAGRVGPQGTLWIVFIGHGAPSIDGEDGLLVGVDARQTALSIETRSVRRGALLEAAEGVLGDRATIVMVQDATFSGRTEAGELAPGLAPLQVVDARIGGPTTVLLGAQDDQIAGTLPGAPRPAYSYLLLGALSGWGDLDGDGVVTTAEATRFTSDTLRDLPLGREQRPSFKGDGQRVLATGVKAERPQASRASSPRRPTLSATIRPSSPKRRRRSWSSRPSSSSR